MTFNSQKHRTDAPTRGRGFAILDAIGGLLLLAMIAGVLTVALNRSSRARDRLAAQREVAGRLEAAMVDLSMGRSVPAEVRVTHLPSVATKPSRGTDKVTTDAPGQWVRLSLATGPEGEADGSGLGEGVSRVTDGMPSLYLDGFVPVGPVRQEAP